MVDFIRRADLINRGSRINEQATVRKAESETPRGATFLSHSSKDRALLPGVIQLLEEHGARVYVDKKDDTLPPCTNHETAALLSERVKESKKFILLTTQQSKDSRWVPWELGLADGYRRPDNVAILPSVHTANETKWPDWHLRPHCPRQPTRTRLTCVYGLRSANE